MKKIATIVLLFLSFTFYGQNPTLTKAKKYYKFYDYYKAIDKFEHVTDKTPEIKRDLASSYFYTGQYELAEKYYAELANAPEKNKEDIYNYVKVLLINKKYQLAEEWMQKFHQIAPNDTRAELFASEKNFYQILSKDNGYYQVKDLDFNNDAQEFAPAFYKKNQIVFSSSRKDFETIHRKWSWNEKPFLDFYIADIDTNTLEFHNLRKFEFNKKYHEGTISFDKSGDFMFFTSDNYRHPSSDGIIKLEMFSTYKKRNGKWHHPKPFPYNNREYSVGHPSLSPDGKTLYFASDMPGGIGGVDIYVSHKTSDGSWSKPHNLGKKINTEANEMFPFYSPRGFLFFASDGRPGLGGLDLFVAKIKGDTVLSVQNLGAPMNSNMDDFALIIDDSLKYGYFSSNRSTGKGDDDIYSFRLKVPIFTKKTLIVTAVDQNGNILTNTTVNLYDNDGNIIGTATSDSTGKVTFILEPDKEFNVTGHKKGYSDDNKNVSSTTPDPIIYTTLVLKRQPKFSLVGFIADEKTRKPLKDAEVVINSSKGDKWKFETDSLGLFHKILKNIQLNDTITYTLTIKKYPYLTKHDFTTIIFDHEGEYRLEDYLNLNIHHFVIGEDLGKLIHVNPIYFDLDKYNIRPDAAAELDKIVKVMNEHPYLVVELGSHTDCRASDAYNMRLSDNRAKSSADYIRKRITNPSRIYGKGYGESRPVTVTEKIHQQYPFLPVGQKLTCSYIQSLPTKAQREAAHQLNRRTEFKIIKY